MPTIRRILCTLAALAAVSTWAEVSLPGEAPAQFSARFKIEETSTMMEAGTSIKGDAKDPILIPHKSQQTINGVLTSSNGNVIQAWEKDDVENAFGILADKIVSYSITKDLSPASTGRISLNSSTSFFAGEMLGFALFGEANLGHGTTYKEILSAYSSTSTKKTSEGVVIQATLSASVSATVMLSPDEQRILSIRFVEMAKGHAVQERLVKFSKHTQVGEMSIPTECSFLYSQSVMLQSGKWVEVMHQESNCVLTDLKSEASEAKVLPIAQAEFVLMPDEGDISYFTWTGSDFKPGRSAKTGQSRSSSSPPWWMLGAGVVILAGGLAYASRRKKSA